MGEIMNKRKIGILLLLLSTLSTNIFGLSLVDKTDYVEEKFKTSEIIETYQGLISDIDISQEKEGFWNGYPYQEDSKYLISNNTLHEFTQNNEYVKTLQATKDDTTLTIETKYLEFMETEKERYLKSGFDDFPSLHMTTIKDDVSYFNQRENKIKPDISCVPTAGTMLLHMKGLKEFIPDDFSKTIQFDSRGTTTTELISSLRKEYEIKLTSYHFEYSFNAIKKYIKTDTPIVAYIKSGYIDYSHLYSGEEYSNRRNRLYYIRDRQSEYLSHAILITGFLEINDIEYIEVYDPWTTNTIWADGKSIPSGKGKFMTFSEFKKIENGPLVTLDAKIKADTD